MKPSNSLSIKQTNPNSSSIEWLEQVSKLSKNSKAKESAKYALSQWKALKLSWKSRKVKTNRSIFDLLSGILEVHQQIHHHQVMTEVKSGNTSFYFPIFHEACLRRGKTPPGFAIVAGLPIKSHRSPQTKKWGNILLKT
jgi:hypothetical protein